MKPKKLTKTEQAAQAAARERHEARVHAALRWTGPAPQPDVPPPTSEQGGLTTGYTYNVYSRRVGVACSSAVGHGIGQTDKTNSQRPISLYSTRKLALQALRAAMEREFAEELAKIDAELETD